MKIKKLVLVAIYCSLGLCGYSQNFKQFDRFIRKSDSAYSAKNYALSSKYLDQAFLLPENQKPEIPGIDFYNFACVYSLNKEPEKALNYLTQSFKKPNLKEHSNPVTADHISNDTDLDFIREDKRFKDLLEKYYPNIREMRTFARAPELSYTDFLRYLELLSKSDENEIIIKNKIIYWEKSPDSISYNDRPLQIPNLKGLSTKSILFSNCKFRLNLVWGEASIENFPIYGLEFDHCNFYGRCSISGVRLRNFFRFNKCQFNSILQMGAYLDPKDSYFSNYGVDSCSLKNLRISLWNEKPINVQFTNNYVEDSTAFATIYCRKAEEVRIINNSFQNSIVTVTIPEVDNLKILGNKSKTILLRGTEIKSEFNLEDNEISSKLVLDKTHFSDDPASSVDWNQLDKFHLALYKQGGKSFSIEETGRVFLYKNNPLVFISGEKPEDISSLKDFDKLMGTYSMFLSLYKAKNNIELYNACYIQIKELQSKRLKHLYESHKTFETYFSWKLSQLLKFYVRYGTNPARAIVISLYIIFCFGVFFFLFPSDWDETSKSRLISNFRDFIQKNEKGYIKPFFGLLGGFALSLLNALTLSLNAFITLGFGNIPTHGIARYVCVLEGFMGWFLLSIFTVALINQVL